MFERDYLMRLIMDFMQGIRLSLERAADGHDPAGAADSLDARSLLLSSRYHADAGDVETAALRMEQGLAVARAYGHDVSASDADPASMERFLG